MTCSANSPSAAESTTPPAPPAADGSDDRDTLARAHGRNRGVDDLVDGRRVGERTVVQTA